MRQINILLDRSWTELLPVYAWAIETPEGVIVVDTGETARTRKPGYFPRWHPYFRLAVRLDVSPEQEVGPQLLKLGIRPDDVRTVILTHLHTDHAGGLYHFPKSEILVSDEELKLAKGFVGQLRGYLPNRWPPWFAPCRSSSSQRRSDPSIEVISSPPTARWSSCRPQDTHQGTSLWLSWMAMSTTSWRAIRHTRRIPSLLSKSMASVPVRRSRCKRCDESCNTVAVSRWFICPHMTLSLNIVW